WHLLARANGYVGSFGKKNLLLSAEILDQDAAVGLLLNAELVPGDEQVVDDEPFGLALGTAAELERSGRMLELLILLLIAYLDGDHRRNLGYSAASSPPFSREPEASADCLLLFIVAFFHDNLIEQCEVFGRCRWCLIRFLDD